MIKHITLALFLILGVGALGFLAYKNIPKEEKNISTPMNDQANNTNNESKTEVSKTEEARVTLGREKFVTLNTNLGIIKIELYDSDSPKTAENFRTLIKKKYYDGLTFHRVISGFMIQGGDPNCGSTGSPRVPSGACGAGGPGYQFEDELSADTQSAKEGYKRGVVAMANSGPNTNGSQFFIMHKDYPLPHSYTIFGKVVSGFETIDAIASSPTSSGDRPANAVIIIGAVAVEK